MTRITDGGGTRWVEIPLRKKRKSPRALRFAEIKVSDQLMRKWRSYDDSKLDTWYYLVTDLWFDPVAGQKDETAGCMVAIKSIDPRTGEPRSRKQGHTIRGLASQGFLYADIDFTSHAKAVIEAKAAGAVVGIGYGRVIRKRPKQPGPHPL